MTHRRRSFLSSAPRRLTTWLGGPGSLSSVQATITASGSTLASVTVSLAQERATLVRTRGRLRCYLKSAAAGNNGFVGAFGMAVANLAAVSAGVSSVPTPVTEQTYEWIYWTPIQLLSAGVIDASAATDEDGITGNSGFFDIEIDSKAMRKITNEHACYGVIEVTEIGTATMQWMFGSRQLFKLS